MDKNKILHLSSKVLKLSEIDNRYIELEMVVSNTDPNLNGVVTTKEFLQSKAETLVDMPLVVDRKMLEAGFTNSLTHKFDGQNLNTDIIGVFQEVWLESTVDDPDFVTMKAKAIVYKRFPETISAIKELYAEDDLKFSWELIATDVDEVDGIAYINNGEFEGHCIVSQPAYGDDAVATKLVASYINDVCEMCELEEDSNEEGGKAIEMDYLAEILKEKSMGQVRSECTDKIQSSLNEGEYVYVMDIYQTQIVANIYSEDDWEGKMYRISYTVAENEVSIDMESKKEIARVWMDVESTTEETMISETLDRKLSEEKSELETKVAELQSTIEELTKAKEVDETETVVSETEEGAEVETEEVDTEESNENEVELAEKVISLSETVLRLESELETLRPLKEQVEAEAEQKRLAEEEANKTRLSELVLRFISADEEGNKSIPEEVQTLISEMDENGIKLWIANKAIEVSTVVAEVTEDEEDEDKPIVVETPEEDVLAKEEEKFELV